MANVIPYSLPDYRKYALPDDKPLSTRLIQIQPRIGDEHPTERKVVLRMRVVDLDPSQLLPGGSPEPIGRPSVRFDKEMNVQRLKEYFGIPQSSMPGHQAQPRGNLSQLVAKLKPKSGHQRKDRALVL